MTDQEEYITTHVSAEPEVLAAISREVNLRLLYPRMCSGHLQGRLLAMITAMVSPRRVLEIGTYAGYSALAMAEGLGEGAQIDTVEVDDEMEPVIRRNLAMSPLGEKVTLHIGDIAQVLPQLVAAGRAPYDLVYMDANKRIYLQTFEMVRQYVRPGGFVIADNTLWGGKATDPTAHDPQTEGIRRFNDYVAADPTLLTVMLPVRDGITLIRLPNSPNLDK